MRELPPQFSTNTHPVTAEAYPSELLFKKIPGSEFPPLLLSKIRLGSAKSQKGGVNAVSPSAGWRLS